MFDEVVLVRRRSPDWATLAAEFRRGLPIDRSRYIPPEGDIPNLPLSLGDDIDRWNARFRTDFFTYRDALARISDQNLRQVRQSRRYRFSETTALMAYAARSGTYFYFHDDDDLYAPHLLAGIQSDDTSFDAVVSPMVRIGQRVSTFVRRDFEAEAIVGERSTPGGRYQTNNYGIHSRHCGSLDGLAAVTEHVDASRYGDQLGFSDRLLVTPLSATMKTPGSASALRLVFESEDRLHHMFETYLETLATIDLPDQHAWLAEPIQRVRRLVECVYSGGDYGLSDEHRAAPGTPLKRSGDPV